MALIQVIEMNQMIDGIVKAVRKKATEIGIENGVIAICCSDREDFGDERAGRKCFQGILQGEDSLKVFSLKDTKLSFTESLADEFEDFEHFGYAAKAIAAAAKTYHLSQGHELTSRGLYSYMGCGGCVVFPLVINREPCGKIYVAVAGGTESQNELCAWAAYDEIVTNLYACKTTNPGVAKYGVPEI